MPASDPTLTAFTAGNLVISVSGDGDGSGDYGDNQASPITLDEVTTSGSLVGDLVLPQTTTVLNGTTEYAISGEYGSSSEGSLALSVDGQSLVIMGYGISAGTFNTGGAAVYGNAALAQSTSVLGGIYTAVPRVVADIGYNTTVDTSTALYDIDNTNNPRSVATVNGTNFYVSGQGKKGDTTQGVFEAADGADGATPIDTSTDTRNVEIFDGELYVSRDSTQGTGGTSNIASYGTLLPTGATTATVLPGIDGTVTLTAAQENTVNGSAVGTTIHLSPENFFFADPTTLYIADGGNPKEGGLGDGGLQKWVFNGTSWVLEYTLSAGLNLVPDTATSGTTGLIGLTGTVVGGVAELYATNSTIGDLDQTYLFGITDTLAATSGAGESFTTLVTAATDTNIRGVSFAPTSATTTPADITVSGGPPQSGLIVTSGSTLTVLSGGTVTSTTVMSRGLLVVSSGGIDLAGTIAHGGSATVIGSAGGDQIDGTQLVSGANAVVSDEYVYNGGAVDLFLKGDVASGLILTNGGVLNISGNAEALNTVISGGGTVDLQSPKATLGGSLTFLGSGTLETTALISSGFGDLAVISGFGSGDVVDAVIGSGLTLTTAAVSGTTVATVSGTGGSETFIFAGSIGSALSLTSDGHGGDEIIYSVPVSNTIVSSGSSQPNLTVSSGSTLTVLSGGTIVGATIFAGGLAVVSGLDSASVISSGGNETILGSATGDQIYGTQLVSAATAVVSGETVFNGGFVDLYLKGGVASGLTVSGGGTLNISGNATAINTVLTGGGVLDLQSPKANVTGSLTFSGRGRSRRPMWSARALAIWR